MMMIVCWYKMTIQNSRCLLSLVIVFTTFLCLMVVFSQMARSELPAEKIIIKSGKFMARELFGIDLQNGVEWMRCSAGQVWNGSGCEGKALKLSQEDVSKAIVIANDQMGPGWRLPTRVELEGLVCKKCAPVNIELDSFPDTLAEPYWTGEVNGFAPRHIWTVNFMTGHTYGRFFPTQEVLSRLVRDR